MSQRPGITWSRVCWEPGYTWAPGTHPGAKSLALKSVFPVAVAAKAPEVDDFPGRPKNYAALVYATPEYTKIPEAWVSQGPGIPWSRVCSSPGHTRVPVHTRVRNRWHTRGNLNYTYHRSVWKLQCTFLFSVLGPIPAELDPETRSNGSGLENGAERDQN